MPNYKKNSIKHCHSKALFQLFNSIYYCMICSAFIFKNNSSYDSQIKTIRPFHYNKMKEIRPCPLWSSEEKKEKKIFLNKRDYIKNRPPIIKNIKRICCYFSLTLKTFFLSVEYLDIICSKVSSFNPNTLLQISLICLILASKFNEQPPKAIRVQRELKKNFSTNYLVDETYILQLLNYKLNINTSYDMVMDSLNYGFILEGENYNHCQMNYICSNIEKILYFFTEINSYIDMTAKQIAISIIGFAREFLNLTPFTDSIKKLFMIEPKNEELYNSGLQIIKKRIKIEGESKSNKNGTKFNNKNKKRKKEL